MAKTKTIRELADIISMMVRVDLTPREIHENMLILGEQYELTKFILKNYVSEDEKKHLIQRIRAAYQTRKDNQFIFLNYKTFLFLPFYFSFILLTVDLIFINQMLRWFILMLLTLGQGILIYQKCIQPENQIRQMKVNLLLDYLGV